jgi:dipeptidyl aminopeptidase/acylaminoacyl peptidase
MGEVLSDAGYRAVLVDLRGHGESSGRFLTYGQVETKDVSSLLDGLQAHGTRLGCIGAYGFSYGGSVAIELGARDPRISAVVAVAPFSTLRNVIGDYRQKYLPPPLSLIPDAWFQGAIDDAAALAAFDPDRSAPLLAAAQSSASLLLIHGLNDTQVPLRHSQALFGAARGNAGLLTVPGADHATMPSDATGVVRRETVAWFDHWFELSAACQASNRD